MEPATNKFIIPEGLDLIESAGLTVIRRVWLSWKIAFLIPFAIIWNGFIFFWYAQALKAHAPLMMVLFPILHVAVGVGLIYFIIASLVNKTDIECNAMGVRVRTYPVPWLGNCAVRADEITGLVVRARFANNADSNQNRVTYCVMYIAPSRKEKKLVGGLTASEQADFIARVIRTTLGLPEEENA
ncbi:MAG: hypothetical protein WCO68_01085 [Verrucomicrobiota bacterium]